MNANSLIPFAHDQFGSLRVIKNEETGEPWLVAKDVCDALELTDPSKTVSYLDDDEHTTISNRGLPKVSPKTILRS